MRFEGSEGRGVRGPSFEASEDAASAADASTQLYVLNWDDDPVELYEGGVGPAGVFVGFSGQHAQRGDGGSSAPGGSSVPARAFEFLIDLTAFTQTSVLSGELRKIERFVQGAAAPTAEQTACMLQKGQLFHNGRNGRATKATTAPRTEDFEYADFEVPTACLRRK